MTFRDKVDDYRTGWRGALIDEFERALNEYESMLYKFNPDAYSKILDEETEDEECRSLQSMTRHVTRAVAGHLYSIYKAVDKEDKMELFEMVEFKDFKNIKPTLISYLNSFIDDMSEFDDKFLSEITFKVNWGQTYDVEQMLEHAVTHVHRHRRQLEKFYLQNPV